jgi:glycosyltransferase involved in cell wall biosynthesis
MSAVKVSVCIPTYNGAEFVAKAIESVLAQTFADFELLVIDDSSNDATVDIVRSFTDPRMRICRNEKRLGIPGNWNRCLSLARGEYICLFHQDDIMLPENLERKVQVLASDATIGFVHSAARMLLEDSAPTALENWIEDTDHDFITDGVIYFRKLFFRGNLVCAPTVVARCQRLLDLGGDEPMRPP